MKLFWVGPNSVIQREEGIGDFHSIDFGEQSSGGRKKLGDFHIKVGGTDFRGREKIG